MMKQALLACTAMMLLFCEAHAALVAIDDAGNYTSWSSSGAANQGSGFGNWSFGNTSGNSSQNGEFLATTSGNGDLSIATSGKAWGLYANSGQTAEATRPFTGASPSLSAGQTFKITMDNGSVDNGGLVGFSLRDSSHANRFEFYFVGGGSNYRINVNGVETDTGVGFTSSGLSLVFQQNSANGFSFTINGGTVLTGTLVASDISEVRFFDYNSGNNNNVYFNSIEVTPVPEPANAALAVFAFGGICIALFRTVRSRLSL